MILIRDVAEDFIYTNCELRQTLDGILTGTPFATISGDSAILRATGEVEGLSVPRFLGRVGDDDLPRTLNRTD